MCREDTLSGRWIPRGTYCLGDTGSLSHCLQVAGSKSPVGTQTLRRRVHPWNCPWAVEQPSLPSRSTPAHTAAQGQRGLAQGNTAPVSKACSRKRLTSFDSRQMFRSGREFPFLLPFRGRRRTLGDRGWGWQCQQGNRRLGGKGHKLCCLRSAGRSQGRRQLEQHRRRGNMSQQDTDV